MSRYSNQAFCPTCHQEYDSCSDAYYDKRTGEFATYRERRADTRNVLTCCKCPKGHRAERIGTTTEECPVCHTIPRYPPFSGITEPCYVPVDIAKILKLKGEVVHLRIGDVVSVKTFDGDRHEFDPRSGRKFGDWRARESNKPCHHCIREIEALQKLKLEIAKRQGSAALYAVLWYPGFAHGSNVHVHEEQKEMERTWVQMLKAIGDQPAEDKPRWDNSDLPALPAPPNNSNVQLHNAARLSFRKDVAAAIQSFWQALNVWGPAIAASAHERGTNLLIQLAEGEITPGDFNESLVRYGRKSS
jgi:hypothetical protein